MSHLSAMSRGIMRERVALPARSSQRSAARWCLTRTARFWPRRRPLRPACGSPWSLPRWTTAACGRCRRRPPSASRGTSCAGRAGACGLSQCAVCLECSALQVARSHTTRACCAAQGPRGAALRNPMHPNSNQVNQPSHVVRGQQPKESLPFGYGKWCWDAGLSADGSVSFDAPAPTYDLDAFVPLEVCAMMHTPCCAACQAC